MSEWASIILQILTLLCVAAAIYGGIRSDLKHLHTSVDEAKRSASRAHERIDSIIERRASLRS